MAVYGDSFSKFFSVSLFHHYSQHFSHLSRCFSERFPLFLHPRCLPQPSPETAPGWIEDTLRLCVLLVLAAVTADRQECGIRESR